MLTKEDLQAIQEIIQGTVPGMIQGTVPGIVQDIVQGTVPDIVLNLVEPIYNRLDIIESRLDKADARMDKADARMDRMEEKLQSVHDSQVRVELEWIPKINASADAIMNLIEKDKEQDKRISALESTTDDHGFRIMALEKVAKAN